MIAKVRLRLISLRKLLSAIPLKSVLYLNLYLFVNLPFEAISKGASCYVKLKFFPDSTQPLSKCLCLLEVLLSTLLFHTLSNP